MMKVYCFHGHLFLAVVFIILLIAQSKKHNKNEIHGNICGNINGRRIYMELGDQGFLTAKNISFKEKLSRQNVYEFKNITNNDRNNYNYCTLELVTCPSCVIHFSFSYLNLSQQCGNEHLNLTCKCDYIRMSEPPYEKKSEKIFCGALDTLYSKNYTSLTRTVIISLFYGRSYTQAFLLHFMSERNSQIFNGLNDIKPIHNGTFNGVYNGVVVSPFFPSLYPRDYFVEQSIKCEIDSLSICKIRLIFTDFQLSSMSIMEFYDWNGKRLDVTSGALFRPPVIISNGPTLLIRFYANGGTGLGYKAYFSFLSEYSDDITLMPSTDCGGYVENVGGGITMMNMVNSGLRAFDCLWIIRPLKSYLMKTHLYLKLVTFENMVGNTELIIRKGLTSDESITELFKNPSNSTVHSNYAEYVVPITSGFYISLRGIFSLNSRLAIVYSSFSLSDCFLGSDFLCENHRCIGVQLHCDGFDHCGDNSDEPSTCFTDWELEPIDRRWYSHTPNYYFPNIDHYPDLKTATLVFIISSLGLIALISALIILLYRMGARARQQRELQNQLQTISDLLDGSRHDDISDEPPIYEAPPDYDEVIKLGLDEVLNQRRKKKRLSRKSNTSRSKSAPGRRNVCKNSKKKQFLNNENIDRSHTTPESSSRTITETSNNLVIASCSNCFHDIDGQKITHNSPPPPYVSKSSTSNSDTYLCGYSEDNAGLSLSSSFSCNQSSDKVQNQSNIFGVTNKWIIFQGDEPTEMILNYELANNSIIRRCRSEDDILNSFETESEVIDKLPKNIVLNESKVNINSVHESASDSNLSNLSVIKEREKLFDRSFKDYKSMKTYFENLFSKTKYPRNQFKYKATCACDGACGCVTNSIFGLRYSEPTSSEAIRIQNETEVLADNSFKSFGEIGIFAKYKNSEDKASKNKSYLSQFRIWKSTDTTLNNN